MKKKSLCRNTLKIILAVSLLTLPVHMTAAADFSDGFQNSETENENFSDSHESSEYANSEDVTEETTEENELSLEDTTDTDDIPLENFSENSLMNLIIPLMLAMKYLLVIPLPILIKISPVI